MKAEPQEREERPRQAARLITKITYSPKPTTTRPDRRLYLLVAMGATS